MDWQKNDRKKNPQKWKHKFRKENLLRRYGITLDQYHEMDIEQDGRCFICKKKEESISYKNGKFQKLAVDHNHETGKVRGLLCFSCNRALGYFKDNKELLISALLYLEEKDG